MVNLEELKEAVKNVLDQGKVKYVISYRTSSNGLKPVPFFIKDSKDIDQITWNPLCVYNLARFLVDEKRKKAREKNPDQRPVGVVVKGCDSRAINVLLQEKYIERQDVYIIGVSCENLGVVDEKKLAKKLNGKRPQKVEFAQDGQFIVTTENGQEKVSAPEILADRCLECQANFPVVYDILLGEETKRNPEKSFQSVEKIESLSQKEKWAFWQEQLGKCIRCYACRSACPMCYCDECVVDTINFAVTADTTAEEKAHRIKWVEKSPLLSENFIYHLVRALHLAGRCVDCGECERACPVDIPLRFLNKKLEKEAKELFGYKVGFDPAQPSLLSSFKDEDPEDFIW